MIHIRQHKNTISQLVKFWHKILSYKLSHFSTLGNGYQQAKSSFESPRKAKKMIFQIYLNFYYVPERAIDNLV